MYGWTEAEALGMNVSYLIPKGQEEKALAKVRRLAEADVLKPYRAQRNTKAGAIVYNGAHRRARYRDDVLNELLARDPVEAYVGHKQSRR